MDLARTVTAIVPTYERPDYTVEAVRSALAQTYPHVEVLVGDDSRSDAVERAIRAIDDPRVRYHRNAVDLGAMGNWVDLVRRSRTDLVASLNDDDVWEPTFLERLVPPLLADQTIAMSCCDTTFIDGAGNVLLDESAKWSRRSHRDVQPTGIVEGTPDELLRVFVVWNLPQPAFAAVMRREPVAAIDFPAGASPCHDLWTTYRLFAAGWRFHYRNERLTRYRVHGGNLTSRGFGSAEDFIFGAVIAENPSSPVVAEVRDRWARVRLSRGICAVRTDPDMSRTELQAAIPDLRGWRRAVAQVSLASPLACRGVLTLPDSTMRALRRERAWGTHYAPAP